MISEDLRADDDRCTLCGAPLHDALRRCRVDVPFPDVGAVATVLVIECPACKQIDGRPWELDL